MLFVSHDRSVFNGIKIYIGIYVEFVHFVKKLEEGYISLAHRDRSIKDLGARIILGVPLVSIHRNFSQILWTWLVQNVIHIVCMHKFLDRYYSHLYTIQGITER